MHEIEAQIRGNFQIVGQVTRGALLDFYFSEGLKGMI